MEISCQRMSTTSGRVGESLDLTHSLSNPSAGGLTEKYQTCSAKLLVSIFHSHNHKVTDILKVLTRAFNESHSFVEFNDSILYGYHSSLNTAWNAIGAGGFEQSTRVMNLEIGIVLKVVKTLYRIPQSGLHWYLAYLYDHVERMKCDGM